MRNEYDSHTPIQKDNWDWKPRDKKGKRVTGSAANGQCFRIDIKTGESTPFKNTQLPNNASIRSLLSLLSNAELDEFILRAKVAKASKLAIAINSGKAGAVGKRTTIKGQGRKKVEVGY